MSIRLSLFVSHGLGSVCARLPAQSGLNKTLCMARLQHLKLGLGNTVRNYARGPRPRTSTPSETSNRLSLRERLMGPPSENSYSLGKGATAGAAAIGLGSLCYYGIGLGKGSNIYENSMLWPQYVRERVHATYGYFGASCAVTALSAMTVFRTPVLLDLFTRSTTLSVLGTIALMLGASAVMQSLPYKEGVGAKQLAWFAHCALLGGVVAPLCFFGGPVLVRAALYTAGIVGGISTVAVCAPSDKFLYMGGPLAVGLGLVFASSLAGIWLPPTTALGAGLHSVALYGGLILFSAMLLYDTQRIIHLAENYPVYAPHPYDPVNASLGIYLDTLQIFMRIAYIIAGGGGNQRRK